MVRDRRWAKALQRRLDAWDMTQTEMSRLVDETPQRINDWVKGRRTPADAVKPKLMERLHIDPNEVVPDWLRPAVLPDLPPRPGVPEAEQVA